MRELGWTEGKNIAFEVRYAEGKSERLPELALEFVRLKVDVIVTIGTPATLAARQATTTIPIVAVAFSSPVELGLATSLARPGGNVTGFMSMVPGDWLGKQLELLKQAAPTISRVAYLTDPVNPVQQLLTPTQQSSLETALGLKLQIRRAGKPEDIESAFQAAARERVDALNVGMSAVTWQYRTRIAQLAVKHRLPAVYFLRDFVEAGGLLSYGPDPFDLYPRAASYVDKILKGANPAELPVEQPTKFELVINLKTARALGLTIPPSLLARADEVIQ